MGVRSILAFFDWGSNFFRFRVGGQVNFGLIFSNLFFHSGSGEGSAQPEGGVKNSNGVSVWMLLLRNYQAQKFVHYRALQFAFFRKMLTDKRHISKLWKRKKKSINEPPRLCHYEDAKSSLVGK